MKIYPVKYTEETGEPTDATAVKPFSSMAKARKFYLELQGKEDFYDIYIMDEIEVDINKSGILAAFEKGQELAR